MEIYNEKSHVPVIPTPHLCEPYCLVEEIKWDIIRPFYIREYSTIKGFSYVLHYTNDESSYTQGSIQINVIQMLLCSDVTDSVGVH